MIETRNGHRCGWCLTNDHEKCCVTIELNANKGTTYTCPCACNTTGEYSPTNPRTRCIVCGRRDVPVTSKHKCLDPDDCAEFIETRRANNPQYQAMRRLREEQLRKTSSPKPIREPREPGEPREPKPAKPGRCRCCDGPTKGGLFLPGHDARYISQQAELIVKKGRQDLLNARLDDLTPALFAKLTKRIERLGGVLVGGSGPSALAPVGGRLVGGDDHPVGAEVES